MVDKLKSIYRQSSPLGVNIDFTELATGQSNVIFYAGDVNSTSARVSGTTILSNNKFFSNNGTSAAGATSDIDFDVVLDKQLVVEGDAVINVPVYLRNTVGGAGDGWCTVTAIVRHWDGTTETDLVTGTSIVVASMAVASSDKTTLGTIKVNVPRTVFKKGETFRLTIQHGTMAGTANDAAIGYDPMGRTDLPSAPLTTWTTSTILSISVPIEVDL